MFTRKSRQISLARERVERGAALLDRYRPGWDQSVNLTDLDLGSASRCVLGQVYGRSNSLYDPPGYTSGKWALGLSEVDAVHYGFQADRATVRTRNNKVKVSYRQLEAAWTVLLIERQEKRDARKRAQKEQYEAYATYKENLKYTEGYADGHFDGQRSMLDAPAQIETIGTISERLARFI